MKNKRKQISNEISIRILSVVITIFVIFSIVVAIMIGNISLSSQKDERCCAKIGRGFIEKYFIKAQK